MKAFILAGTALLAVSSPLMAQDAPPPPPAEDPLEGVTPEEIAQREAANAEQLAFARKQLQQNSDNEAAYLQARSEYEAAYLQARSEYEAEVARIEQEKQAREVEIARIKSEHDAAVAKWEADVAACEAGDWSRCDKPKKD